MKKITLKDIGEHFGVSISTVSKAVRDSHEISKELKLKIQTYAKEKHYKPNKLALNLLNKSTRTIGVVVPNILNYFFIQVLYGIEQIANEKGYSIISCVSDESNEKEGKTLEVLDAGTVDGLIISLTDDSRLNKNIGYLKEIAESQIPLVLFDRVTDLIACDKVVVDDYESGFKTTEYFINIGCKNIAVVTPISNSNIGKLRIEGYKKALLKNNILFDEGMILNIGPKQDLDLEMSFLLNYKKVDALLCLDEITAVQVQSIVKERGYSVPGDISIIGFTNGQLSQYVTPAMTMVSQHGKYIGEMAAKMLIKRIEEPETYKAYETKVIKTSLIVRESTRKLEK
ncbi:LacI family DNA-binding transcriptional regulator [uncultured Maribacter sp.]|uniref:LacI family DNA-binding transcriptional regulator n=1 Tax=uncultured Maribacter sp. TaxID=431308 RepID=UPI0026273417|nr:LacI family DNA-binding transcriptional regulator [uncultured Maribacter sp.]